MPRLIYLLSCLLSCLLLLLLPACRVCRLSRDSDSARLRTLSAQEWSRRATTPPVLH